MSRNHDELRAACVKDLADSGKFENRFEKAICLNVARAEAALGYAAEPARAAALSKIHSTDELGDSMFLDVASRLVRTLDFVVYAAFPLGFAVHAPGNALPAAILLASFLANGSAFLAFSVLAPRRGLSTSAQGKKSIYYLSGLAEGFETIVFMVAACLFPAAFPILAYAFAVLCFVSAGARLVLGCKLLG